MEMVDVAAAVFPLVQKPINEWIGISMSPRAFLDVSEKRENSLAPAGIPFTYTLSSIICPKLLPVMVW